MHRQTEKERSLWRLCTIEYLCAITSISYASSSLEAGCNKLFPHPLSFSDRKWNWTKQTEGAWLTKRDHLMQTGTAIIDKDPLLHPREHRDKGQCGKAIPGGNNWGQQKNWTSSSFLSEQFLTSQSLYPAIPSLVKALKQIESESDRYVCQEALSNPILRDDSQRLWHFSYNDLVMLSKPELY